MNSPLVSIVIPCHNAAPYLAATLESVFAQTWPHCEVILVDDGSTDDSASLAQAYVARGLQVLTQPNRGAAAARNAGLAAVRGEFIQFLDADDLLAPDKIARQLAILGSAPRDALAMGPWGRFTGQPALATFAPQTVYSATTGVEFLQLHYESGSMMQPGSWLAPRELLARAGPWNESLSLNDDGEYFARVMLAARELVFVPEARCYYRGTGVGSLSRRTDRRALDSLYRSVALTTGYLLAADPSPRSRSAAAYAWKWAAFELYPGASELARAAEDNCRKLGDSARPFPAGGRFQLVARFLGWRLTKRLRLLFSP